MIMIPSARLEKGGYALIHCYAIFVLPICHIPDFKTVVNVMEFGRMEGGKQGKTLMELHNAKASFADDVLFTNVCVCNEKFVHIVHPELVTRDTEVISRGHV